MRPRILLGLFAGFLALGGCRTSEPIRPIGFDAEDLHQTLVWLRHVFKPVVSVPEKEVNPLAEKEAKENELRKFTDQTRPLQGSKVRWTFPIGKLSIDGFDPVLHVKHPCDEGYCCGNLRLYRESKPKVEPAGLFSSEIDHAIKRFEVGRDVQAVDYKLVKPKDRVVIEGNIFDIRGWWVNPDGGCFEIVLVNVKVAGFRP